MIRTGLCSVTLRALAIGDVAAVTAAAGLESIEWGGDVHVPPGDVKAAEAARSATAAAGLRVASYGSYYRCHGDFDAVLASARGLGAPRIRIWAGEAASAEASQAGRDEVARAARDAAERAAADGIEVAFEFHGGTLTDDAESALDLIEATHLRTYWQPPQDLPDDEALDGLTSLLAHVTAVHVFSWWPGSTRRRLAERFGLWRGVFERFTTGDALLEFVPGDDPKLVADEARTLFALLEEARRVQA